jgi:hypothetical protein
MNNVDDVINQLQARASNHGIDVSDLIDKIPPNIVDSHLEVNEWLSQKDVSHIYPQSTHPTIASDPDNVMWEDSTVNRARGAEVMTEAEILTAEIDNQLDADIIDSTYPDTDNEEWLDALADIEFDSFTTVVL